MANVREHIAAELHRPAIRRFARRTVRADGKDDLWQADLVDMKKFSKVKKNKNHTFLLTVIDVYTKYGWAVPLKNKSGKSVATAFAHVIETSGRKCRLLHTDRGLEFTNKDIRAVYVQYNIRHYQTYTPLKASVCERWNRTLKEKMWKAFTAHGNHEWLPHVDDLVATYNTTEHSAIRMTPTAASREPGRVVFYRLPKPAAGATAKPKFGVGDTVRLSKHKTVFDKGYAQNWSNELFTVTGVRRSAVPPVYTVRDHCGAPVNGTFYAQEMSRTRYPNTYLIEKNLRRKGDMQFVKYAGMPVRYNAWIKRSVSSV